MLKWMIFDADGVLVDSEHIAAMVMTEQLTKAGLKISGQFVRSCLMGRTRPGVERILRRYFQFSVPSMFWQTYYSERAHRFENELTIVPEAAKCIDAFRDKGVKTVVATDASQTKVFRNLEIVGLSTMFDLPIISGMALATTKRSKAYFGRVLQLLDVEASECAFVDDRCFSARNAMHMGIRSFGYVGPGAHGDSLRFSKADIPVVRSLADLINIAYV